MTKYRDLIQNVLINQNNLYNPCLVEKSQTVTIKASFSTFGSEKNVNVIKLFNLVSLISSQRPYLKTIKFNYIKKKILKRLILGVSLNTHKAENLISYFYNFYSQFFHIYYQNPLKYNYSDSSLTLYLDNIQFFLKNYVRQNHRTQIKIKISSSNGSKTLIKFLAGCFLVKLKKNELLKNKK
jgi:hypothetical protein